MRKVLEILIGTSVLVIGTCVGDVAKLAPIGRYGDSMWWGQRCESWVTQTANDIPPCDPRL